MTANTSIDPALFLRDQLASASPDVLRDLLTTFIDALRGADGGRSALYCWRLRWAERT